jgi:hypothetical protein
MYMQSYEAYIKHRRDGAGIEELRVAGCGSLQPDTGWVRGLDPGAARDRPRHPHTHAIGTTVDQRPHAVQLIRGALIGSRNRAGAVSRATKPATSEPGLRTTEA